MRPHVAILAVALTVAGAAMAIAFCRSTSRGGRNYCKEFAAVFPVAAETQLGGYYGKRQDEVQATFCDRYILTLQQPSSGPEHRDFPLIQLSEIASIDLSPDGRCVATYGMSKRLTAAEWNTLLLNKGNWNSIGIQLKCDAPVPMFRWYWKWL